MATNDDILNSVRGFFLESRDFNGIPAWRLAEVVGLAWPELQERLRELVAGGHADLAFASHSENAHIKRLPDLPVDVQLEKLRTEDPDGICVYPSRATLFPVVDGYNDRPYTLRLALAEAQLTPVFFELRVLEPYFRDPRYLCQFRDRDGSISVSDAHYRSEQMAERDKVLLQTFGIGYDRDRNRVVVVFLRYLADLSPEHQQIWRAHELADHCTMNSDYERASIWGQWPEHYSVYEAFIQEQIEINRLAGLIGKPSLFNSTFEGEKRPLEFSPMLRPTRRQYLEFVHLLDKMLSENVNRDFFRGDIPLEDRVEASDGSVERRPLNSITLLERWLKAHYRNRDGEDVSGELVQPWRDIRRARQAPAHALREDEYDLAFPKRQDELLETAIRSLTRLRLVLSSDPQARSYKAPEWLDGERIVFY